MAKGGGKRNSPCLLPPTHSNEAKPSGSGNSLFQNISSRDKDVFLCFSMQNNLFWKRECHKRSFVLNVSFSLPQLWPGRQLFSMKWFLKIRWLLFPFPHCRQLPSHMFSFTASWIVSRLSVGKTKKINPSSELMILNTQQFLVNSW